MAGADASYCSICLDDLSGNDIVTLSCHKDHAFHKNCILGWALTSSNPNCPLCRVEISTSDLSLDITLRDKITVVGHFFGTPILVGVSWALKVYSFWILADNLGLSRALLHAILWLAVERVVPGVKQFRGDEYFLIAMPVRLLITQSIFNSCAIGFSSSVLARVVEQKYFAHFCSFAITSFRSIRSFSAPEHIYRKEYMNRAPRSYYILAMGSVVVTAIVTITYIPRAADYCFDVIMDQVSPLVNALVQR